MSRTAKQPLNPAAVAAADAAVAKSSGRHHLTMDSNDADLRVMWMDHYIAAGGKIEEQDWGKSTADEPITKCSDIEEETYVWFFSA